MNFKKFKEWIDERVKKESTTSSGDVANYARRVPIGQTKEWPLSIDAWEEEKEKKHGKKDKKDM